MEVSALKYSGGLGLHGRPSLLRLQSDERLIAYIRRGNQGAFEVLLSRYETRLLAFCRHMLGSREDAEDVLQEVMTAAFNAILADERPINVRPWLYRIARNRSLNHLRRARAIASDEMDAHFSDHGASTADKAHEREEFRLLVGDIHELPESQKTALVLREMDAMSYEQIAEAMETTVPSVKSLLVRARVSLAEAAEARLLSCDEVRIELGEIAEGLRRRPSPLVRRHLRSCDRCSVFRSQLRQTNKALAALLPIGPFMVLKKFAFVHLHHTAGAGAASHAAGAGAHAAGAGAAGAGAAGAGAAGAGAGAAGAGAAGAGLAVSGAAVGSSVTAGGGILSAGLGAIAGKAAAGLAAAAIVTAGAVEADHSTTRRHAPAPAAAVTPTTAAAPVSPTPVSSAAEPRSSSLVVRPARTTAATTPARTPTTTTAAATTTTTTSTTSSTTTATTPTNTPTTPDGRGQTQSDPTVLPTPADAGTTSTATPTATAPSSTTPPGTTTSGATTTDPGSTSPTTTAAPLPLITITTTTASSPAAGEGSTSPLGITVGASGR